VAFLLLWVFFLSGWEEPVAAARKSSAAARPRKKKEPTVKEDKTPPVDEQYYDKLWTLFELGSTKEKKEAVGELRKRLKKEPTDGLAHFYLGLMLAETGPATTAEQHLRAALTAFPESAETYFKLGEVLSGKKSRAEEARGMFEHALANDPNHAGALAVLGQLALLEGNAELAHDLLLRARASDPENRDAVFGLGNALFLLKRYDEAIPVLEAAAMFDEKDADSAFLIGKCHEALGHTNEAAEFLRKARELGHREMKELVGLDLARALAEAGKYVDAVEEYKKGIKVASAPDIGWFELGDVYQHMGETDLAMKAFQKAFELNNKLTEAVYRIGRMYRDDRKLKEALGAYDVICKAKDQWGDRARTEIEEISEEMIEDERDRLLEIAGDVSETDSAREKAYLALLEINKKDEDALRGMLELTHGRGDYDESKRYAKVMKRYGYLTPKDVELTAQAIDYQHEAGDDIAEMESRLEECKRKGDWKGAIEQHKKLVEQAKKWRDYWADYRPKTEGQRKHQRDALKNAKWRLKSLGQDLKDLRREAKRNK
jgi:tetratricopeptide (TPR) repeat protein